jgi:uncharacterized protein
MIRAGPVFHAKNWRMEYSMFAGWQFNYWGSLFVAFGYIGLAMLFCRSTLWPGLKKLLSDVGRMAFSNYLLQTLICTTLFYGHGFGLFGRVERTGQILIVFAIWIVLVLSKSDTVRTGCRLDMSFIGNEITRWQKVILTTVANRVTR